MSTARTWSSSEEIQKIVGVWLVTKRGNVGGSLCDDGNVGSLFLGTDLRRAGNGQFLQMVHEDLQADVVSQNGSACLLLQRKGQTKGTIT